MLLAGNIFCLLGVGNSCRVQVTCSGFLYRGNNLYCSLLSYYSLLLGVCRGTGGGYICIFARDGLGLFALEGGVGSNVGLCCYTVAVLGDEHPRLKSNKVTCCNTN